MLSETVCMLLERETSFLAMVYKFRKIFIWSFVRGGVQPRRVYFLSLESICKLTGDRLTFTSLNGN